MSGEWVGTEYGITGVPFRTVAYVGSEKSARAFMALDDPPIGPPDRLRLVMRKVGEWVDVEQPAQLRAVALEGGAE